MRKKACFAGAYGRRDRRLGALRYVLAHYCYVRAETGREWARFAREGRREGLEAELISEPRTARRAGQRVRPLIPRTTADIRRASDRPVRDPRDGRSPHHAAPV